MAQAAYRMSAYPEREQERRYRPDVRVVPGSRNRAEEREDGPGVGTFIALALVAMFVFAAALIASVTLKTMTSGVLSDTSAIETSMDAIKHESTTLEVQNSSLSNTNIVKAHAEKLGMSLPDEVGTITLEKDIVVLDDSGALSLSGSIKNAASIQG
jgi:cell division protein FtsL